MKPEDNEKRIAELEAELAAIRSAIERKEKPSNEVLLRTMNALERLAFLRRKMPSHGTHAEEMVNAFQTVQAALDAATKSPLVK